LSGIRGDNGPHFLERFDYPMHRPPQQRRIAGHHALKGLPREDTRKQPHSRPAIAAIKRAIRRLQAILARAGDGHVSAFTLDLNSEGR
jgi:hypothetical protein